MASAGSTASPGSGKLSRSVRWCVMPRPNGPTSSPSYAPLIALAMPHIGHPAIRNRGTLRRLHRLRRSGGRVAGLPSGARRRSGNRRPKGKRTVKADDFFKGLFETALRPEEIADSNPYSGREHEHALRLCRAGAPPWRLCDRRTGGQRARRRQGARRSATGLFRRRRHAHARAQSRGGARWAATSMPPSRRSQRSRSARRRAGDRPR